MDIILKDLGATEAFAQNILNLATALKNENKAVVVALHGDLGTGKTTLSQFIASSLGVNENVSSPTFVIQKTYSTNKGDFKRLVHIDAYRIENPRELNTLKIDETLADKDALVLVEWPEKGGDYFGSNASLDVFLELVDENTRKAKLEKPNQSIF